MLIEMQEVYYRYPDGVYRSPSSHMSWMGTEYEVITKNLMYCQTHSQHVIKLDECTECVLNSEIDRNNLLRIKFQPEMGMVIKVKDQYAVTEDGTLWSIKYHAFHQKIGKIKIKF